MNSEQMNWQPIDTAPTDGTVILGLNSDTNLPETVLYGRTYWQSASYYLCKNDEDSLVGYDLPITHWCAIPTIPN